MIKNEGKMRKSDRKYEKIALLQQEALDSYSTGLWYESGMALSAAIKKSQRTTCWMHPKGDAKGTT